MIRAYGSALKFIDLVSQSGSLEKKWSRQVGTIFFIRSGLINQHPRIILLQKHQSLPALPHLLH